ncbi:hypothetical protein [Lentzea sp. NPDC092896]|uniref:hypothetical protein n=1 Tax=Lentzea sp. NPDC092896 TaxID=3364127 RepID=UPI00381FF72C
MTIIDGYGTEPAEVALLVQGLIGERTQDEEDEVWFIRLSSTQALFQAAAEQVSALRDDLVAEMVASSTERDVAIRLNLSPTRPGQLARRSRRRRDATTNTGPTE